MSGPIGSQQWMYNASSGFYPYELNNSLKFEDGDSSYLSRTPASDGNRKTFTLSCWLKRGNLTDICLLGAGTGSDDRTDINLSDNAIFVQNEVSNDRDMKKTTAVLRDPSSWYHIVVAFDLTASSNSDKVKIYINGDQQTSFAIDNTFANVNSYINGTSTQYIGRTRSGANYLDGYLAEYHLIDGTQLTPSSFGETKEGIWIPKEYSGSYGTNGFYLPFKETTTANGFNTVTYSGNGATQSVEGVGFQPDFVWVKERTSTSSHVLTDSVRGVQKILVTNSTAVEASNSTYLTSFNSDGFSVGTSGAFNASTDDYVAWCWDAGTGNAVSNSDGSITSTVKANQDYGFSVVSYTGNGSDGATVGHGLSQTPEFILIKKRANNSGGNTGNWIGQHVGLATDPEATSSTFTLSSYTNGAVYLNLNNAQSSYGFDNQINGNTDTFVAYCFHSVTGYQKISSYSGTGSSGNAVTGLGFKPAWLMVKRIDSTGSWQIFDTTRDPSGSMNKYVYANLNNTEASDLDISSDADGFTVNSTNNALNNSSGTYIYLAIADTRDALFTSDASGNGNHWTPNDLQNSDVMPDTPTDGFATWNAVDPHPSGFLMSEGNLKLVRSTASSDLTATINIPSSGAYYFEVLWNGVGADTLIGLGSFVHQYRKDGKIYNNNSLLGTYATYTSGDIVGVGVNADNDLISFYKNGTLIHSFTGSVTSADLSVYTYMTTGASQIANFGQDSSFNATKVPQGNTDANGKGDFFYAPPSGYLALCNANLPDPAIDPNKGENPEDYFNIVSYSGNSGTNAVTGVGFQPDWTWVKSRNTTGEAQKVVDSVRGAGLTVFPSGSSAEIDYSGVGLNSFDTDGFTVSHSAANNQWNVSGRNYIAYNWKAGGTAVTNNDGSIQSTVSANTDAGFSIATYTGNNTAGATVGHGLGVAPKWVLVKSRSNAHSWIAGHEGIASDPWTDCLLFDTADIASDSALFWNDTAPSSSVVTLGGGYLPVNGNGYTYVMYSFAEKKGYSKFGSYTGNSSNDGPFVYTGFKPAYLIMKATTGSVQNWHQVDNARNEFNVVDKYFLTNSQNAELTAGLVDFLSNGFKIRNSANAINNSGVNYVYIAFAEQPFKYSNAR